MVECSYFHWFAGWKRFHAGFYVFGIEGAVNVDRLNNELKDRQRSFVAELGLQ